MFRRLAFLTLLLASVVLFARVSERYNVAVDVTAERSNSLSATASQALEQLGPGVEMVAFVPDLAVQRLQVQRLLAPYLDHASAPKLRYVDPLASPDEAEKLGARRQGELHLRIGDRREIIAAPDRAKVDQALNRLGLRGERWIVSLTGHGELRIDDSPSGIGRFAALAESLGYRVVSLDPRRLDQVPDNTALLLVAEPKQPFEQRTATLIGDFIATGGRLLWLAGQTNHSDIEEQLGIRPLAGIVVDADAARFGLDNPAHAIIEQIPQVLVPQASDQPAAFYQARAFEIQPFEDWRAVATLKSSVKSWNETGELTGRLRQDADAGEQLGPLTVGAALERASSSGKTARVVYLGASHMMRNAQIGVLDNKSLLLGLVYWLTENQQLIPAEKDPDNAVRWSPSLGGSLAITLMGVLPIGYLGIGLWLRMRRRRA